VKRDLIAAVESLEHALDLKDFNRLSQIRIKHLKEIITSRRCGYLHQTPFSLRP
jgi:hypothetical protein